MNDCEVCGDIPPSDFDQIDRIVELAQEHIGSKLKVSITCKKCGRPLGAMRRRAS